MDARSRGARTCDDRDVMHRPGEQARVIIVLVGGAAVEMRNRTHVMPLGEVTSVNELARGAIANVRDRRFMVQRDERSDDQADRGHRGDGAASHEPTQSSQRPRSST